LMAQQGYYYRLWLAQARNVDTEDKTMVPIEAHSSRASM